MKKYLISKTPFIRSVDSGSMSTTRMMYDQLVVFVSFIMFEIFAAVSLAMEAPLFTDAREEFMRSEVSAAAFAL